MPVLRYFSMIRKKLILPPPDMLAFEITDKAPVSIAGLRFFEEQHSLSKDPINASRWVLANDAEMHSGSELMGALEQVGYLPQSGEEALQLAELAIFLRGSFYGHWQVGWDRSGTTIEQKGGHFEVTASISTLRSDNNDLVLKIGPGVYSLEWTL